MTDIGCLLLTFNRTEYALKTIDALNKNWLGPNLKWYIADNGSTQEHIAAIRERIGEGNIVGFHSRVCDPAVSWNMGLDALFTNYDVILQMEDDWEMLRPLDATVWVETLRQQQDLGMIRMGNISINLSGITKGDPFGTYVHLEMDFRSDYCYSGGPHLKHKRFHESYGTYMPGLNQGDIELDMNSRVMRIRKSKIWIPLDHVGTWGLFGHIGTNKADCIVKDTPFYTRRRR